MQRVRVGISRLEFGEKLERSLVGFLLKAFDHFRPMLAENFAAASMGSVAVQAIGLGPDDHPSLPSPLAPIAHSSGKSLVLFGVNRPGTGCIATRRAAWH